MRIAGIGFAIGLPLSLAVARLLRSQLYLLGSFDLASFAAACAISLAVTIAGAAVPARSAANLNPVDAIGTE